MKTMNREIKFRGLRTDGKGWVHGHLVIYEDDTAWIVNGVDDSYTWDEVIPESVSQYIGLKDKNGVEIYEGDVVFNSNKTFLTLPDDPRTYEVVWVEGEYDDENKWLLKKPAFSFRKIQPNNKRYIELIFNQNQIEVIGNIHEKGGSR